jgi:hypothetical protein
MCVAARVARRCVGSDGGRAAAEDKMKLCFEFFNEHGKEAISREQIVMVPRARPRACGALRDRGCLRARAQWMVCFHEMYRGTSQRQLHEANQGIAQLFNTPLVVLKDEVGAALRPAPPCVRTLMSQAPCSFRWRRSASSRPPTRTCASSSGSQARTTSEKARRSAGRQAGRPPRQWAATSVCEA